MLMWSWGANSHGQLGLNMVCEQIDRPTTVGTDFLSNRNVKKLACGGGHTLLLDDEGKLFSCGWNTKLQLGRETETNDFERVWNLSGITFTNIVCGWDFSCGVTDSQLLVVWGSNTNGQLGLPRDHFPNPTRPVRLQVNACAASMGLRHTAIVNSKGDVWTTGCGKYGQLGLGIDKLATDRFEQVLRIGVISHIACGQNHTVAWSSNENALYVWGDNRHSQLLLSVDKYKRIFVPQKIDIDVKHGVRKLLSGWTNVLLWLDNGALLTWGRNNYGQLGTEEAFVGKIIYVTLPDGREVQDVALGSEHTVCLASDNTLWAWGWNEHSNTGTDAAEHVFTPTRVSIELAPNIVMTKVFASGAHNFVVANVTERKECNDKETDHSAIQTL